MTSKHSGKDSQKQLLTIAVGIIIALLAVNVILLVNRNKAKNSRRALQTQLDESAELKRELEEEYYAALSELEEMRGSNEELNALIEKQQQELQQTRNRIEGLLRNKANLDQARREIAGLNAQVERYLAEINQLRQENEALIADNERLNEEKETLRSSLAETQKTNEQLSDAQASLLSEKEELQETKSELAKKVDIASVIEVDAIDVTGFKIRNNGSAASRRKAKNIEQLQVCFHTTRNLVAEARIEEFIIRLINPQGETLAIESLGSGFFEKSSDGEKVRYTKVKTVNYQQGEKEICTNWAPSVGFTEGLYQVEIYNKGYLAGRSQFELK